MKNIAQNLGVDIFQLTLSTKFGSVYETYGKNDPLEPSAKYVSNTHRFTRTVTNLSNRKKEEHVYPINLELYNKVKNNDIIPLCEIGNKGLYINSQGKLFPCCWVANRYNHNSEWQILANKFDLHAKVLHNVLEDSFWETELKQFRWQECKTKCTKEVVNQEYATSW